LSQRARRGGPGKIRQLGLCAIPMQHLAASLGFTVTGVDCNIEKMGLGLLAPPLLAARG
jgi:hypothetical protein